MMPFAFLRPNSGTGRKKRRSPLLVVFSQSTTGIALFPLVSAFTRCEGVRYHDGERKYDDEQLSEMGMASADHTPKVRPGERYPANNEICLRRPAARAGKPGKLHINRFYIDHHRAILEGLKGPSCARARKA